MSKIIQIQDINSSDTLKTMVEKINYNFDQIMAFGGGPKGEMGLRGFIGPDGEQGEQGERGNLITVVDDISTVGDNLKAGDLAIYSNDQYIYKVEEIDGEKHFVRTDICIKGNAGESGTSDSPFGYSGDTIVTNKNGTSVPKYTFIGTDTTIKGHIGNLNVVGSDGIHIFKYTDDTGTDNYYCGKIYGGELDSENNILVLQGEDNDDNYVKIDDTLLADKIHSSDNGIKIAEIINDGVVLGDGFKNASIECEKFTVTSSNINLKGNLFVNNDDYNYTTKICGNSININSSNVIIGNNLDSQSKTQINGNVIVSRNDVIVSGKITAISSNHNLTYYNNQLNIADVTGNGNTLYVNYSGSTNPINEYVFCQGAGISAPSQYSDITCANVHANGNATATVNNIPNVYLGCPIGTIMMWIGTTAPDGWFLCDGSLIQLEKKGGVIPLYTEQAAQTIQNIYFSKGEIQSFVELLGRKYRHGYAYCKNGVYYNIGPNTSDRIPLYNRPQTPIGYHEEYYIALPDFRGMFPIGSGTAPNDYLGEDSKNLEWNFQLGQNVKPIGEYRHKLTQNEMPEHNHKLYRKDHSNSNIYGAGGQAGGGSQVNITDTYNSTWASAEQYLISNTGNSNPHNNVPPYTCVNFIIKYK